MSAQLKMGFKLAQKLKMNPQLQQSIKMLSLPLMELEQAVRDEMLENPVLEEVQDIMEEQTPEELSNKEEMPERHTWMEYTDFGSASIPRRSLQKGVGSGIFNMENVVSTEQSLYEHITWQIQMSGFSNQEKAYLNLLVDYLSEDGYLKNSLEEISAEVNVPLEDLQKALALMHTLDPSGVGARNLKECLLIQAQQNQEDTSDLVVLIEEHLQDIEKKNFDLIAEKRGLDIEEVMDICKIISAMEPKPGRRFISQPVQYVTPDVYVTKERDDYRVTLNEEGLPHLRVVGMYQQMLKDSLGAGKSLTGTEDSTQRYLRHKMNSALWLIRSLNQRQRTIFKVTSAIVRHQKEFFDKGPIGMKPLILQQIAEDTELHISTVSRVTTNKYVHTPHGVYELKYFFNVGIETDRGTKISGEVVKLKILTYIKDEDKENPVSDQEIIESLQKDLGVHLSRRTISKYRESMNILPFRSRKTS